MGRNSSKRKPALNDLSIPYDGVGQDEFIASSLEAIQWISRSTSSLELKELAKEVSKATERYARNFFHTKLCLKSYHLDDFVTSCKNHSDDLRRLMSILSLQDSEVTIVTATRNNGYEASTLRYLNGKCDIHLVNEEDEEDVSHVFHIHRDPKFFSHLYLGVIKCMQVANRLQYVAPDESRVCIDLSLILISASRLYLEFRSNSELWSTKEQSSLELLKGSHSLDMTHEFLDLFQEVKHDLEEGRLPYVREMKRAILSQSEFIKSPFGEKDFYYSAKASTSRIKSLGKQNSLVSSAFEVDHLRGHPIDEVIGYKSYYNNTADETYQDDKIRTIAINQHKLAPRIIHIANNAIQDRCNYLRRRLAAVLKGNPSDCTTNQSNGVTFVAQVTHPTYRLDNGYPSVYCMDFSNATDTLDQEFQGMCLGLIFEPEIVKFWREVSQHDKVFRFRGGKSEVYKQTMGQPQGLLGSFDSFALAHHIIMLMVMKASGRENYSARKFYRVLGDDSAISTITKDPERIVQRLYVDISTWAGLRIQEEKGLSVLHNDRTAMAEFAKVTVLNGEIMSPPPIRIMSRIETGTTNYYSFATAIWMLDHGFKVTGIMDYLLDKWYSYDVNQRKLADIMIYGGIIPQFQNLTKHGLYSDSERAEVALCYAVTKLKGSIVENLLSDKVRESLPLHGFKMIDAIESILPENPDVFLDLIENSDHKLIRAIESNLLIEDSIKSILGIGDVRMILPLLDLTEDEIGAIFAISDLLELASYGPLDNSSLTNVLVSNHKLRSLDRFQMRSHHKQSAREIEYLNNALALHSIIFPSNSLDELV